MDKYTIRCTEEQTKKALKLGAPIEITTIDSGNPFCPHYGAIAPTAEQMIGWLEKQEDITNIVIAKPSKWVFLIYNETYYHSTGEGFNTRQEATLAAIDAALEYLSIKKE